jgi:hypothetical protein
MKTKSIVLLFPLLLLFSCSNSGGRTLPSVTGTKYEVLVVMNDAEWKSPAGRSLVALLDQDMYGLPQAEAIMNISRCKQVDFADMLKPSRNILITDISEKYTQPKITYTNNRWAQPQSVVRVVAPNDSVFVNTIKIYGENILKYFIDSERDRQIAFNKDYINGNAKKEIEKMFGIQIDIIQGINKVTKKKDFYWITNDHPGTRQDIVIYSYPYTDQKTFTKEYLLAKRDSVMKVNIPGEFEGSYMGTEYKHEPPILKETWVNEGYCAEIRGLWKIINGGSMGGPFFSHSRLDEINQRVITIEGFVFAPGAKKRNPMRQLEAVIYSAKLPQEINALKEVSIVATK